MASEMVCSKCRTSVTLENWEHHILSHDFDHEISQIEPPAFSTTRIKRADLWMKCLCHGYTSEFIGSLKYGEMFREDGVFAQLNVTIEIPLNALLHTEPHHVQIRGVCGSAVFAFPNLRYYQLVGVEPRFTSRADNTGVHFALQRKGKTVIVIP